MELIECPSCGKQISDKAIVCPNCGHLIVHDKAKGYTKSFLKQKWVKIVGTIIIIYIFLRIIFCFISAYDMHT